MMKSTKYACALAVVGAMAIGTVMPSKAQDGRIIAGVGIGLATGALLAANANGNVYYGPGPYYGSGYAYGPGYAYAPGYAYGPYAYGPAYAPAPTYTYVPATQTYAYAPVVAYSPRGCWVPEWDGYREESRGLGHWGSCAEPHARPAR
jgi:hypothetical protein